MKKVFFTFAFMFGFLFVAISPNLSQGSLSFLKLPKGTYAALNKVMLSKGSKMSLGGDSYVVALTRDIGDVSHTLHLPGPGVYLVEGVEDLIGAFIWDKKTDMTWTYFIYSTDEVLLPKEFWPDIMPYKEHIRDGLVKIAAEK